MADADVVITALPDGATLITHIEVLASEGALPGQGTLWIDLTSCDPDSGEAATETLVAHGIQAVAAPLAGGPSAAGAGQLRFHVGGAADAIARAAPYLALLGGEDAVLFTDPRPRAAYLAKLLVNGVWFAHAAAIGEALLIGSRHGIERSVLGDLLRHHPALRGVLEGTLRDLVDSADGGPFELERIVDQLRALVEAADRSALTAPLTVATARLHQDALRQLGPGPGELRAIRHLELLADRTARTTTPADG